MHELAPCTVRTEAGQIVGGFVRTFDGDVLAITTDDVSSAPGAGQDVIVDILDEVRGECRYAGFVARVSGEGIDVADAELVSTLQKRQVVRVRVAVPCRGVVVPLREGADDVPMSAMGPRDPEGATRADEEPADGVAPWQGPDDAPDEPRLDEGPLAFTLLDISAHGMKILARETLRGGSTIRFWFLELDEPFPIDAVVLRAQQSRTGTHYGCRFVNLTSRQSDELFRYVLQTQGAQRRERLRL